MIEPQDLKYQVKCYIEFHRQWVKPTDDPNKPKYERTLVFLLPDMNTTENQRFFDAWYPFGAEQNETEIIISIPHPVNGYARVAFCRADKRCNQPYLVLMSPGVEKILIRAKKMGDVVIVEAQPAKDEEELNDQIIDLDAPIEAEN